MGSFLLQYGVPLPTGTKRWSKMFMRWLDKLSFPHRATQIAFQEYVHAIHELEARVERLEAEMRAIGEDRRYAPTVQALQALRGVGIIPALTLVAEVGEFSRFRNPAQRMAFAGLVPREHSSGIQTRRGGITKTGNAHIRFVLGEAAWAYRHKPAVKAELRKRQQGLDPQVLSLALKAQQRLHRKYWRLLNRGKPASVAACAVARELFGFVWAMACHVETQTDPTAA